MTMRRRPRNIVRDVSKMGRTCIGPGMSGQRTVRITLLAGDLERVDLDPDAYLPDVDRTNNDWTAE